MREEPRSSRSRSPNRIIFNTHKNIFTFSALCREKFQPNSTFFQSDSISLLLMRRYNNTIDGEASPQ